VTLWNLRSSAEPWPTHLPVGQVYELRYSPSGEFLTAATDEGVSLVWDPRTGRLLHKLTGARVVRFGEGIRAGLIVFLCISRFAGFYGLLQ
jgi:WD40 repeat protein